MTDYKKYFKAKKIIMLGLGVLGRGIAIAKFLSDSGASLLVTDLKSKEKLESALKKLKGYKKIKYVLGEHRLEDFRVGDMVLKAASVPLNSPYIKEASKHKIPIEMDASLFFKLAPGVNFIGVTGTRGKTTTTYFIYEILKTAKKRVYLAGNIRGASTLPLLTKIKDGDYIVAELDSWQLQGFGDSKISPHVSVFTTFLPDHMNYYKGSMEKYFRDKANIFKYQKKGDIFVVGEGVAGKVKSQKSKVKSKLIVPKNLSKSWTLKIPGEHNRFNAACAVATCHAIGIDENAIRNGVENFKGVEGRLQFLCEARGIKIYNDNNSTTPDATIAALRALGSKGPTLGIKKGRALRNIVLIMGGDDKNLDMSALIKEIPEYCSKVVLFKERGTERIRKEVFAKRKNGVKVYEEEGLKACVEKAFSVAEKGEIILYSPAFSSFGKYFKNEYDRGDQFVKMAKKLK